MTVVHEPLQSPSERQPWHVRLRVPEMWASLAIISMWLAVLFDALLGPDIVTSSNSGDSARIPSAVVVVLFAYLATRVVARYGFGPRHPGAG